ncbi:hypothetical protein GGR56DRAFT_641994 [Xylariaceae sp. FL0804]|nr:hypothetical protein GGR56DRAFT_641994 [Xylariaceae sp. FL0804]
MADSLSLTTQPIHNTPTRCAICQFAIHKGDAAVIIRDNGNSSPPFRYGITICDLASADVLCYCRNTSYPEDNAPACHAQCLRYKPAKPSQEFSLVTTHAYNSPASSFERREEWLLRSAASSICLPPQVPLELRTEVSRHLLPEYAACYLAAICRRREVDAVVDLSAPVCVRYMAFEGIRYVASLVNRSGDDRKAAARTDSSQPITVFICEDHLGIREVVLSRSPQAPQVHARPGVWWRTLASRSTTRLRGYTDGVKLRSLAWENDFEGREFGRVWDVPVSADARIRFHRRPKTFIRCHQLDTSRMVSVLCNDPSIRGYSFCYDHDRTNPMRMYAHTADNEDWELYKRHGQDTTWIYIPITNGEVITEIWKLDGSVKEETAYLIKTSSDVSIVAGPQVQKVWDRYSWDLVDRPAASSGRIFFNDFSCCHVRMGIMAFMTPEPRWLSEPPLPTPNSPFPEDPLTEVPPSYFYSVAPLDDVVQVTVCRKRDRGVEAVVGLLFEYRDGRQACVGEVRLDCLDRPFRVDGSRTLRIAFRVLDNCPYASEVTLEHPLGEACAVLATSWTGKLEWWYSDKRCQVHYGEQSSPSTRL